MICPACGCGPRPGSTECPNCGGSLLSYVPTDAELAMGDVPVSEGRELLWSGLSVGIRGAICRALDEAKIEYKVTETAFGLLPATEESAWSIWSKRVDRAAARRILQKLLGGTDAAGQAASNTRSDSTAVDPFGSVRRVLGSLPGVTDSDFEDSPFANSLSLFDGHDNGEPTPDDLVEDFDPEGATAEVWTGEDSEMAGNLSICLRNVGVGCVLHEDGGKSRLLVRPEQAKRAREVVRQVLDAT